MRSMMVFTALACSSSSSATSTFSSPSRQRPRRPRRPNRKPSRNPRPRSRRASQASRLQLAQAPCRLPRLPHRIAAALETETTVENAKYKIVFTNRGAQVSTGSEEVQRHRRQAAGHGPAAGRGEVRFPLSLFTYEPALSTQLNQALYQVTASGAQPSATMRWLPPPTRSPSTTPPTAWTWSRPSASTRAM
jgi:hypothetical protein